MAVVILYGIAGERFVAMTESIHNMADVYVKPCNTVEVVDTTQ